MTPIETELRRFCSDHGAKIENFSDNGETFSCLVRRKDYTCFIPMENSRINPETIYNRLVRRLVIKKDVEK